MSQQLARGSWGCYPYSPQQVLRVDHDLQSVFYEKSSVLPYGMGRSYGDSCLNSKGLLLGMRGHNHFLAFDSATGVLRCESGVTFEEIIRHFLPRGWFLPVTPGTKYITLGGAIANDVHGKNHHVKGCFGSHVKKIKLLRSDREPMECSLTQNSDLFAATIGGMGLTGIIDWAEVQLIPVSSGYFDTEVIKFKNLAHFMEIEEESKSKFEYTVAWLDGLASGEHLGRGLYIRGNHSKEGGYKLHRAKVQVPFNLPSWSLNSLSVKAFNFLYYNKQTESKVVSKTNYDSFFYPLDAITHWNRIYGRKGFVQYQFVIPKENAYKNMRQIMRRIAKSNRASFLTVLKSFGAVPSPGMMSFPRSGLTYALDFAVSKGVFPLLDELDQMVMDAGGAIYPAKDARMQPEVFLKSFPRFFEFMRLCDPKISSDFIRRISQEA